MTEAIRQKFLDIVERHYTFGLGYGPVTASRMAIALYDKLLAAGVIAGGATFAVGDRVRTVYHPEVMTVVSGCTPVETERGDVLAFRTAILRHAKDPAS